jgi:Rieske Fe-S protein
MDCVLDINREEHTFECSCHGGEFDPQGNRRYGTDKCGLPLPALPQLKTRGRGNTVDVFASKLAQHRTIQGRSDVRYRRPIL